MAVEIYPQVINNTDKFWFRQMKSYIFDVFVPHKSYLESTTILNILYFNASRFGRLNVHWSVANMTPDHVNLYRILVG
jgi:hypothetical protein